MDICAAFIPNLEPPEAVQPRVRALDDPAVTTEFRIRGRPPLGRGSCGGSKGSMTAHNSSETIGLAIGQEHQEVNRFCFDASSQVGEVAWVEGSQENLVDEE